MWPARNAGSIHGERVYQKLAESRSGASGSLALERIQKKIVAGATGGILSSPGKQNGSPGELQMRRGFSILLILLFGFGPLSAMVDGSEDANLPPCCRRHGAHHCTMAATMAKMQADPRPTFSAPLTCPYYPGPTIALLMPAHALTATPASVHAARLRALAPVANRTAACSIPGDAHAGRGPPTTNLS